MRITYTNTAGAAQTLTLVVDGADGARTTRR
jgi:hypothetical protein